MVVVDEVLVVVVELVELVDELLVDDVLVVDVLVLVDDVLVEELLLEDVLVVDELLVDDVDVVLLLEVDVVVGPVAVTTTNVGRLEAVLACREW